MKVAKAADAVMTMSDDDCAILTTIACAIVDSRLHYVKSILTGISPRKIHHLQRVQKCLARVVTRSTTNTTSALNSLHWLLIQQRINFKLATVVHRSLHNAGPQYMSSSLHYIASASLCLPQSPLPTSNQHCSRLSWFLTCWPFSLEFQTLIILDLPTHTSNPI